MLWLSDIHEEVNLRALISSPPLPQGDSRAGESGGHLGLLPATAAAEVRPHTGEVACVADFTVAPPINAVDLRNPRGLVPPFLLADALAIG